MADSSTISKSTLTDLFHYSRLYHRRRLRELFRIHYNPFKTDVVWTKDLPDQLISDLRLHLSWDIGLRTFDWSREAIGTRILLRFEELGILLFLKKVIIDEKNTI